MFILFCFILSVMFYLIYWFIYVLIFILFCIVCYIYCILFCWLFFILLIDWLIDWCSNLYSISFCLFILFVGLNILYYLIVFFCKSLWSKNHCTQKMQSKQTCILGLVADCGPVTNYRSTQWGGLWGVQHLRIFYCFDHLPVLEWTEAAQSFATSPSPGGTIMSPLRL